jgi:hypothetical protein
LVDRAAQIPLLLKDPFSYFAEKIPIQEVIEITHFPISAFYLMVQTNNLQNHDHCHARYRTHQYLQ